jgi:ABC-type branched-subunit amino acid transport system permease subunit
LVAERCDKAIRGQSGPCVYATSVDFLMSSYGVVFGVIGGLGFSVGVAAAAASVRLRSDRRDSVDDEVHHVRLRQEPPPDVTESF